jgi:hypothetical protein
VWQLGREQAGADAQRDEVRLIAEPAREPLGARQNSLHIQVHRLKPYAIDPLATRFRTQSEPRTRRRALSEVDAGASFLRLAVVLENARVGGQIK